MHEHHLTSASLAGALALIALLAVLVAALAAGTIGRRLGVLLAAAIVGGAFQLGHFVEHLAQAGYWTTHRSAAPWMTPWGAALADSFGRLTPGTPGLEMELLHLVGNGIFLVAAIAIAIVLRRSGIAASRGAVRFGVVVQLAHVAEHVVLTATVAAGGRARGLSTLFGALQPGPGLWTYRIWWHLTINAVATTALAIAVLRHVRDTRQGTTPRVARPALSGHAA